jgi:hypothetical protein
MLRILCAAIWIDDGETHVFHLTPNGSGYILGGYRHNDIIEIMPNEKSIYYHEQGFLASDGRYYDRKKAMEIAIKAGQVKKEELHNSRIGLFSEDLY